MKQRAPNVGATPKYKHILKANTDQNKENEILKIYQLGFPEL